MVNTESFWPCIKNLPALFYYWMHPFHKLQFFIDIKWGRHEYILLDLFNDTDAFLFDVLASALQQVDFWNEIVRKGATLKSIYEL